MKVKFTALLCLLSTVTFAQEYSVEAFETELINWQNKDLKEDKVMGTGVDKLYNTHLKNMQAKKKVVVAVIDGGVDVHHEDLKGCIWTNIDEIPDNGIDDDNNGYIDDMHGWNFLGNRDGENVNQENLEYTRIVKTGDSLNPNFAEARILYDEELEKQKNLSQNLADFEELLFQLKSVIYENTGIIVKNKEDLKKVKSSHPGVQKAKKFLNKRFKMGFSFEMYEAMKERNSDYLSYFLNLEFNPRELIGDDLSDFGDNSYGNNDVIGPRSEHGTSVAGVIAANRSNGKGVDGITNNVEIMSLRTTPNGDERDKDVALAIIYAVDNGAEIINMSFGKAFSTDKHWVDSAVRYAEKHDVLLVHAAGNEGKNIDETNSFPNDRYLDDTEVTTWINIGASGIKLNKESAAIFSNYGKKHVDIFAPGLDLIACDSASTYSKVSGTSIAAPVVSGIAALLLSYFPDLTSQEIIEILFESSHKITRPKKVYQPNLKTKKRVKVPYTDLCKSGGIVDAYAAFELALERSKGELNAEHSN